MWIFKSQKLSKLEKQNGLWNISKVAFFLQRFCLFSLLEGQILGLNFDSEGKNIATIDDSCRCLISDVDKVKTLVTIPPEVKNAAGTSFLLVLL